MIRCVGGAHLVLAEEVDLLRKLCGLLNLVVGSTVKGHHRWHGHGDHQLEQCEQHALVVPPCLLAPLACVFVHCTGVPGGESGAGRRFGQWNNAV